MSSRMAMMECGKGTCARRAILQILDAPNTQRYFQKRDPKAKCYVYDRNKIMRASYGTDIAKPIGTCVDENGKLFHKMVKQRRHWGSLCDRRIYLIGIYIHSRYVGRDIYHVAVMYYDKDGEFRYRSKANGMYHDFSVETYLDQNPNLRRIFLKATAFVPENCDSMIRRQFLEKLKLLGFGKEEIILKPVKKKKNKSLLIIPSQVILQSHKTC